MNVRISQLPSAPSAITGAELVPIVQNGQTVQTTVSAITSSPSLTQTFLTVTNQPTLPNSRYFAVGTGLGLSDGGAQSSLQLTLNGTSGSLEVVGTGIIAKTAANTVAARTIGVGSGLSITNANGVAGNPSISVSGLLAALVATSGSGLLAVSGGTNITVNLVTGTADEIDVANGNSSPVVGLADNPIVPGVGGLTLPNGTTAERVDRLGTIRYSTSLSTFEGRTPTGWQQFALTGGVTSFSGGSTGLTPATATTGAIVLAGTLIVANGGTGATSLTGYVYGNGTSAMTASATIPTSDLSGTISNAQLANSSITIGSTAVSLGSTISTFSGVSISGSTNTLSNIGNSSLTNSSITINGSSVSLGGSVTVTAVATNPLTIGTGLSGTSYNGSTAVTIAISATGVTAATYGSASEVPVFAVNAQGQITSVTNTSISIASSAITDKGLANGLATLDGSGTVPTSQLPAAVLGALKYQGTWNASTNTPTLTSSVGTQGYYYVVDVAGSTNLNGITDWKIGDWAIFNGSIWEKIDNTDAVTSVNGYTGTVVLSYSDVGAPSTSGTNATGTWGVSISGNAATATSATTATTATNANNVAVTTGSASTNYLAFVTATTGNLPVLTNSGLTYNSSTNAITGGIAGGTF